VLVSGSVADKPSRLVAAGEPVVVTSERPPFVSRGGEKLAAALERFAVDVSGAVVLDAGASTGGFTDCLLQNGASRVIAVDVGHAQLHSRLQGDPRVDNLERHDVREVTLDTVGGRPVDAVTGDLSFISALRAVPVLTGAVAGQGAPVLLLVKPQFEAGRLEASRAKGVIRDPDIHRRTIGSVAGALVGAGAAMMGVMPSPITGRSGNIEFFVYAVAHAADGPSEGLKGSALEVALDAAVSESRHLGDRG